MTVKASRFDSHFPTLVLERDHEQVDAMNRSLEALILDLEKRYRDTAENAARDPAIATEGGYQTSTRANLLSIRDAAVDQFRRQLLLPAIDDYLREVLGEAAAQVSCQPVAWSNVLRRGDWQRPHCHASANNIASGVYYVRVPEEAPPHGCIEFVNPVPVSMHHGYSPSIRVTPREGLLLLFPPYHQHFVHPVTSDDPRIVIAFDTMLSPFVA